MCGRYSLAGSDLGMLRDRFPIGESVEVRQRFNVCPGDDVLGVLHTEKRGTRGELLRWGLVPPWAKSPEEMGVRTINARAETVDERPAFRDAFARRRCLILADGYYEWQPRPGGPKQPYWITRPDGEPFAFAGLWSFWRAGDEGDGLMSCAIVTTAANPALAGIHPRVPVILRADTEALWLDADADPAALRELFAALRDEETVTRPVSGAVNDARYDGPECVVPAAVQAELF